MSVYRLSSIIQAHDFDVKALSFKTDLKGKEDTLASGSRDGTVKLWGLNESNEARLIHSHHEHLNFVNSVLLQDTTPSHPAGYAVSGGADNNIRVLDVGSFEMAGCLSKHSKNVCALAGNNQYFFSGSWDSTAIVWDNLTLRPLWNLMGHENAVWAILILDGDRFITGSADKTIKIWHQQKCIKTLVGHTDCVRGLQLIDKETLVSVSNDGSIKFWNLNSGTLLDTWESAHSAYIYSIAVLNPGLIATAGEDRCIKIWDVSSKKCIQSIPVPAISIWTTIALNNSDIACGTNDGYIYVYSSNPVRQLFDEALLEVYEERLRTATVPKTSIDSSHLSPKERLDEPGSKPGEHILVQQGKTVCAYQWDGREWIKIGDVVDSDDSDPRKEYQGQFYDYVFDVQVEDGGSNLKLPYNLSENPYNAAQQFVIKNNLNPDCVDQVVDFILKHTKQPDTKIANEEPVQPKKLLTDPIMLTSANLDGIFKKISEFNENQADLTPINGLIALLKKETTKIPANLDSCLINLAGWPSDKLFPVLDLVRMAVLNAKIVPLLNGFIEKICLNPIGEASSPKISQANATMQLRILCNGLASKSLLESFFVPHQLTILKTMRALATNLPPKEAPLAHQSLFNFCLMMKEKLTPDTAKFMSAVLLERCKISDGAEDLENIVLLLASSISEVYKYLPSQMVPALATAIGPFQDLRISEPLKMALRRIF